MKLTVALWAYRTTYKVTTQTTPFSLVYGLEATLPIEFEVESLRVAVQSCLTDSQSLRNRLTTLEKLDEGRRRASQHIEAIQWRRKITFDKRHKKRALTPSMMVITLGKLTSRVSLMHVGWHLILFERCFLTTPFNGRH